MRLGVHVSILGSIDTAIDRALEINCNTFQMFTRNPRSWKFKNLTLDTIRNFTCKLEDSGINPVVSHMPYLPNLASPRDGVYELSIMSLISELKRCEKLRIPYLVTHLGSHLGTGTLAGLERISAAINRAFTEVKNDVLLLLENTSGSKNSMGASFKGIDSIIDCIDEYERIGICFDTCHAFAAGYDLSTNKAVNETMKQFDNILGFDLLRAVHLNDSKGDLGNGIDRHEHIGLGKIGENGFKAILKHENFRKQPLILETPVNFQRSNYENLEKIRELYF